MAPNTAKAGVPRVRVARGRRADVLYRVNRLALYAMMFSYVPAIIASVAGMVYGAYRLTSFVIQSWQAGEHPPLGALALGVDVFVLIASLLLLFGLLPLFFRETDRLSPDFRLNMNQHPRLDALIKRLCKRLNVRPPDACYLHPFDNTGIGDVDIKDDNGSVSQVRTLVLGAGLIVHARIDEYTTILCHEIAHAATGDTRLHNLAQRFFTSLATQASCYEDDNPDEDRGVLQTVMYYVLLGYFHLFALIRETDSRYREFRADRVAAEICGPQNIRNALIRTHLVSFLPQLSIEKLWIEYSENDRDVKNIYTEHRRRWEELPAREREQAENQMFMEETSAWSSHPALADRIRNLADVRTKELAADQSATTLFDFWEHLEERMTDEIVSYGRAAHAERLRRMDLQLRGL